MKKILLIVTGIILLVLGYMYVSSDTSTLQSVYVQKQEKQEKPLDYQFSLDEYLLNEPTLDKQVDVLYNSLSERQRIAQLFMPAVGSNGVTVTELERLISTDSIGGFMMLGKGVTPGDVERFKELAQEQQTAPLFAAIDAEPSLVKYRLPELTGINETASYTTTQDIQDVTERISTYISDYGFNINFAPVYDINANQAIIGTRSHGETVDIAAARATTFAQASMDENIIPTAKHFPGHGAVIGDSHKLLPIISDELVELESFEIAIQAGVPMIMVGHLAVEGGEYDTDDKPATLSRIIQTKLLRQELGFQGLIITDAFNMAALSGFSNNELESLKAGADIILMPQGDLEILIDQVMQAMQEDPNFNQEVEDKVRRILRLKLSVPGI